MAGVSRRTVFRDLDALRDAGVALQYDRQADCYSLTDATPISPVDLNTDELVALSVVTGQLGNEHHVPLFTPAAVAARKLQSQLSSKARREVNDMASAISLTATGTAKLGDKSELFDLLLQARQQRRVLRMQYESLTEWETVTTKLRPYQLLYSRHSWYVIGRSNAHGEVRTFKLARIASLELLDEKYALPRGFSLRRYLKNAWRMVPEPGKDLNVVIRFSPLVATNVAEVIWHPTQRLEPQDDGSLLFHAKVSGVNEISWWILGYGDQAEVLKPARLRKLIATRVKSLANLYDR